ncbi:MAG: hypothetical protein LBB58_06150 [Cellulomonadaceae bacterium]|jgi:hypothetical protein|nr:hypothetical protein [Cellulomonadaceae bacterium]
MMKVMRHKKSWVRNVAISLAGVAAFTLGINLGNLAGASEPEIITVEPVAIPLVTNDFCEMAPVTCAPYLALLEEPTAEIGIEGVSLTA